MGKWNKRYKSCICPNNKGRFFITWIPDKNLQNRFL